MHVFIGLDGGGTACRAQAELECGQRTPVLTGGAANVHSAPDDALREISKLLAAVMGHARTLVSGDVDLQPRIVLGLAGASESGAAARLKSELPYPQLQVTGDIDISLVGAFGDADGIVMAVGTGSVLARQRALQMQRIGGYGLSLGDEGSGAWIGREALRCCLHARDGIGPAGPLVAALGERFGTLPEIIGFSGRARPADFASLAPLVLEHDRAHCAVAGAILDRGCAYLLRAITRLQDGAHEMPVTALGGLGARLLDRIMALGGAHLSRVEPKGTALDGAIWKARQSAG